MEFNLPDAFWSLTAPNLMERLHTSPEGLPEVEVRQRLDHFGRNTLKVKKHAGVLSLLLSQYKSPVIILLLFACLLSVALRDHVDALIILAILLVSGLLGFWQEYGANNAVAKLLAIVQIKVTGAPPGYSPGNPGRGDRPRGYDPAQGRGCHSGRLLDY